jgi:phenylacetate-CoA ligase
MQQTIINEKIEITKKMGKLDLLYHNLPVWAQHSMVSAYGVYWYWLRFGGCYQSALNEYLQRERLTADEWRIWQRDRLRKLLSSAACDVPFYSHHWSENEKKAAEAGRLDDLPLLDKDAVRADPLAFLQPGVRRPLVFHTSGSTGTPVASMWSVAELRHSMAVREARSAHWSNVSFRLPRATFSGRLIVTDPSSAGPFYRLNLVEKQAYFSAYHLRPDTAQDYVAALGRHNIEWLTGYAVSYYLLAKYILDQGLSVPKLRSVVTTSEKVTDEMRQVMEKAYGCQVFEEYSTVENVHFVSECEQRRLHVSPDIGVLEILRPDGTPCDPGEPGEVVATGLMRQSQPLIRYRIGDLAAWDEEPCPCGREMPVIKEVIGRIEDIVTGPDGRQMVRFHGVFVNQPHVREGQIIQETLQRIRVRIVPSNGFGETDVADIIHRVRQRLGSQTEVIVEQVNEIPRTRSGKFQAVVSLVERRH